MFIEIVNLKHFKKKIVLKLILVASLKHQGNYIGNDHLWDGSNVTRMVLSFRHKTKVLQDGLSEITLVLTEARLIHGEEGVRIIWNVNYKVLLWRYNTVGA